MDKTTSNTEPKNYLEQHISTTNQRLEELEKQIVLLDNIVSTLLPVGARLVKVKEGDLETEKLYVPYKQ